LIAYIHYNNLSEKLGRLARLFLQAIQSYQAHTAYSTIKQPALSS